MESQMCEPGSIAALALDLLPWGVVVADGSGRIAAANAAARVLLALDARSGGEAALRCEGRPIALGELLRDHAAGQTPRRRVELEHADHGLLRATLTRAGEGAGEVWVHLVVERAGRRDWRWAGRSDPLTAFAHELRNALTSLREAIALLGEAEVGPLTEAQRRLLDGARQDADRMARMTSDMVAVSHVRAGRIRVAATQVDVGELAEDLVCSHEAAAARAAVRLELGMVEAGLTCHADRDLLAQALSNLVGNALKFTPPGGTVCLEVRGEEAGGEDFIEIAVYDTGPGLSAAELESVLSGDGPARPAGDAGRSGLGIGLAIARQIVEHHGGRLGASSQPGAGSCFRVFLPRDFRRGEHWRLVQIADGIKLARAVKAPLSVVEVGLWAGEEGEAPSRLARSLAESPLVAHCLEESLRPSDVVVVGEGSATLVLYDVDGPGAARVAERAVSALARLLGSLPLPAPCCGIRAGVASYPADGSTASEVARAARLAMRRNPMRVLGVGEECLAAFPLQEGVGHEGQEDPGG